jgi:transitional endoplasmic reticulum ATPase
MAEEKISGKVAKLRVAEALQDDAYKGIARVDMETMKEMGVKRGDIISIKGGKETVAIVDRAYPADVGEGIIRIDGILRRNAKTGVGESVIVKKAEVKEAKKILIAPAQKGIMVQADAETLRNGLLGRAVVKGDIFVLSGRRGRRDVFGDEDDFGTEDIFGNIMKELGQMGFMGGMNMGGNIQQIRFVVANTNPNQPVVITENTEVQLSNKAIDIQEDAKNINITYEDIGGLKEEVRKIREMVELPLKHPEVFEKLGIEPPKGVLLYGPPGTGKTLLAKAVAAESEANFVEFNTAEVNSALHGQTEKNIAKIFEDAEKNAPSIIFIDELDSIAFKREDRGVNEFLNTPVMALLKHMDGLKGRKNVIIIGATNRIDSIDPALRRPGRFDREIEIGVPDKEGRLAILKIHTRNMPLAKDVKIEEISAITHGFVGADIAALVKEAAINVIRRVYPDIDWKKNEPMSKEILDKLEITHKDFKDALRFVNPSAMREVLIETPTVKWEDIGGIENVKTDLKEAVELPLKKPEVFTRLGIRPPRGLLLYGPPGTGKTLLAQAVATESEANFISVKGPELISKWVGESEKAIRRVFEKARQVAPCIIFFDEIDSIASRRGADENGSGNKGYNNVLNQLLVEMDGLQPLEGVTVIAATNRPDILDPALLRPGRFDRILYVSVPDKKAREIIMNIHSRGMPLEKIDLDDLAEKTEGYTGADIEALFREAAMIAIRENLETKKITLKHIEKAMQRVPPSVTKHQSEKYKQIEKDYLKSARASLPSKNEGHNYFG